MRQWAPRSLTSRLVVTAVALVAVVSVLVAGVTTIAMQSFLTGQLDEKVQSSVRRVDSPPEGFRPPDGFPDDSASSERPRTFGNQEPGTLVVFPDRGVGFVLGEGDTDAELSSEAVDALGDLPTGDEIHQVTIDGHGDYRVIAHEGPDGLLIVTGLPTDDVSETIASLVRWEAVLALLGIVAAALTGTAVVRRQLRPLTEVAATAHAVAELPLDEGEIGVTERVPEHLTDPRTEAGQVGLALNQLLAHVESSLSARHRSEQQVRQFVADASHELRTPLTTIAGYTELARRRGDADTAAVALSKVEEESARMTALVEDLLLLARLDAGRPLASESVDLTRLLLEAVDDARVVAPDHRWQIVVPSDGEPVEVVGDGHRLHQVVTNLLTNARKYTPAGTTVTVTVRPDGFDVHDDGQGFPADLVGTAFERFTRGDVARHRSDGAGLGLALVQAIAAAHGGAVTLSSVPGDTRVSVRLQRR
ncbi:sensor histidine kinase [Nocardioides caeni]|uniref:histidine kinase n=1 Tax=Nocardioides caeni TaxID=574700 RepID=A0A4S8N028_9ACTN|nr:HAMP domain-containing sensor histidine kinase [Nocardioides caeni]THV08791.1 HAMP domain-containing histidine kinase [Nocardioides caeni]